MIRSVQALSEVNFNGVTVVLPYGFADRSSHWQFMRAVSQRHEGSSKRVPVYGANVELRRFELLTSSMRTKRSTN